MLQITYRYQTKHCLYLSTIILIQYLFIYLKKSIFHSNHEKSGKNTKLQSYKNAKSIRGKKTFQYLLQLSISLQSILSEQAFLNLLIFFIQCNQPVGNISILIYQYQLYILNQINTTLLLKVNQFFILLFIINEQQNRKEKRSQRKSFFIQIMFPTNFKMNKRYFLFSLIDDKYFKINNNPSVFHPNRKKPIIFEVNSNDFFVIKSCLNIEIIKNSIFQILQPQKKIILITNQTERIQEQFIRMLLPIHQMEYHRRKQHFNFNINHLKIYLLIFQNITSLQKYPLSNLIRINQILCNNNKMFEEDICYYSVTLEGDRKRNCDWQCGQWKQVIIQTQNKELAQEVFIFHLIGKTTKQKMTTFQFNTVKEALENCQYSIKKNYCNCRKCERTLHLNLQVLSKTYDFNRQPYRQIASEYDEMYQAGEIKDDEPTIDFNEGNTQQLIHKLKQMEIQ